MKDKTIAKAGLIVGLLVGLIPVLVVIFYQPLEESVVETGVGTISREKIKKVKDRYGDLVERIAAEENVDPNLVMAVILAESAGKPDARSPRGATGLMQLMKPTADEMADEVGIRLRSRSQLKNPETNIRLGTHYLAKLMSPSSVLQLDQTGSVRGPGGSTGFDYQLDLVLAAYNAGPGNVRKWLRQGGGLPPDELITRYAPRETRRYVPRVKKYIEILESME